MSDYQETPYRKDSKSLNKTLDKAKGSEFTESLDYKKIPNNFKDKNGQAFMSLSSK